MQADARVFHHDWGYEIPFDHGGQITIEVPAGSVLVRGWEQRRIEVRPRSAAESGLEDLSLSVNHAGQSLRLTIPSPRRFPRRQRVELELVVPRSVRLLITGNLVEVTLLQLEGTFKIDTVSGGTVLEELKGSIDVDTGQGNVVASKIDGDLRIDTGRGSVQARLVTGNFHVDTGAGGITGELLLSQVHIDSGSGPIVLRQVQGPLDIDLATGQVVITGVSSPFIKVDAGNALIEASFTCQTGGKYHFENAVGDIQLEVNPGEGFDLKLESDGGTVETDFLLTTSTRQRGQLAGSFGHPSASIRAESGSGRILLRRSSGDESTNSGPGAGLSSQEAAEPRPDPELDILELLAQGKLSPEEAEMLLARLHRHDRHDE